MDDLQRIDHDVEKSLERFKEQRTCKHCVCFDGDSCDLDHSEHGGNDSCGAFEAWE
jgi:hypothetical protein